MAGRISMGARREITAAVAERYRVAGRAEKGRILDELCAVTGWHRKHAVRALADQPAIEPEAPRRRRADLRRYRSRMRWWRCGRRPIGSAASGSR